MEKQYQQNIRLIVNILVYVAIVLLCIFLLPKIIIMFMPFVIGWLISCIANPPVMFLERKLNIKRKAGTFVVIVAVIAAVVGIIYLIGSILVNQMWGFIREMPDIWSNLQSDFAGLGNLINKGFVKLSPKWITALNSIGEVIKDTVTNIAGNMEGETFEGIGSMVGSITNAIIAIIMTMLSSYFFIADRDYMIKITRKIVPEGIRSKYDMFYNSIRQAVGGYFKAQFRIEVWIYLLILIGLTILQVKYAFLIALLIAILDFLPFFGSGAVFLPWAIIRLIGGDYIHAIGFLVIWGVGQFVRQIIQPKIMGDSIGVAPIPTLFLLLFGYRVAGVAGMLLAVPIGIIVINMNDAGLFDDLKYSIVILMKNLNMYRKLTQKDLSMVKRKDDQDEKNENNFNKLT